MNREVARKHILDTGIIPAVRVSSAEDARFAAEAVTKAGIPIVEITMTVPGALDVVADLVRHLPDVVIGTGTVLDLETAERCVAAGTRFLTSPSLDTEIVAFAKRKQVLVLPGAVTPTEVTGAWQAGADFVKVFPCAQFGGPAYLRALKAPFPQVPMIAAGGVTQQTAADFILAGAAAIGVGTELIPRRAVDERQRDWIMELARRFLNIVKEARGHIPAKIG